MSCAQRADRAWSSSAHESCSVYELRSVLAVSAYDDKKQEGRKEGIRSMEYGGGRAEERCLKCWPGIRQQR